jgi:hypothetical protein
VTSEGEQVQLTADINSGLAAFNSSQASVEVCNVLLHSVDVNAEAGELFFELVGQALESSNVRAEALDA